MNLPPFDENKRCPKCGHDVVSTAHQRYGCIHPAACGVRRDGPEHLDRTCQRCHFEWAEAVLDRAAGAREG